jgi:hypothetical protein
MTKNNRERMHQPHSAIKTTAVLLGIVGLIFLAGAVLGVVVSTANCPIK